MTIVAAICMVSCVLIICSFTFFTIIYLSELKREKQIRQQMADEGSKLKELVNNLPVVLMDLPAKPLPESTDFSSKKKNFN